MSTSRNKPGGFTLLEVMLAVAVLSLLMGVMMTLVEKSLEITVLLDQEQQRVEQRQGIIDLLRMTFRTLPNDTQFVSRRVNDAGGTQQQLVFANAPDVLAWGSPDEMLHSSVVLGLPPQLGGGITLAIKRIPAPNLDINPNAGTPNYLAMLPQEGSSDDSAPWLTLLEKVKSVQWRFLDPRAVTWLDDWTDPGSRPGLVELTLQYLDEEAPQKYVFWIPPVVPNARPRFTTGAPANNPNSTPTDPANARSRPQQ